MKLENSTSLFNMGDTSMRVSQVVDVYKVALEHIDNFMRDGKTWRRNTANQEEFYRTLLKRIVQIEEEDGIELFRDFKRHRNYALPTSDKVGLRGRTLTNGLIKTGLIDSNRNMSEVGSKYLNNTLTEADPLEKALGLQPDNLLYLRQFLKLRIYSHADNHYFYNFRFAIKFLSEYSNIPQNDFLKILLSVKPNQSLNEIQEIINNYEPVSNNNKTFDEFYKDNFTSLLRSEEELSTTKDMFLNNDFTDENFIKHFSNSKSSETSLLYKKFVLYLIKLTDEQSEEAFEEIKSLSRNDRIKKAFSSGKIPFKFSKNESIRHFLENNNQNPLLSEDHYQIYLEFVFSKHNDLIREYSDMCRRTFQITGLISFDNGLVNLSNKLIIETLLDLLDDKFVITGEENYSDYENEPDSVWFKDITTMQILNVSNELFDQLIISIGKQFGITDFNSIAIEINNKHEEDYRNFVDTHFPKDKVIEILNYITVRNDERVFELVTDNATIPTIYEYILTIAWYHLSEIKNFKLHETFQVTLDGNKLPLSHRGGGAGDIEIITDEYTLLIEATLMDKHAQKRGELEPVIRHSINFNLEYSQNNPQSIFIANELDENVLNIFRASQFVEMSGTSQDGKVQGLNIFAFTTKEVIQLLQFEKKDTEIIQTINDHLDTSPTSIASGWREKIIEPILN